ncbi:MAG TPA: 2-dehydropantoate 2-reductase [Chthoniobacterales bacterium]|nr:2-dehydropantoate 2-reductase [Chthoniobacterales bacterium]
MTKVDEWPRIAVVGAGAVGGYFGGMFAQAGAPVVMIGRKPFVEAVSQHGLVIDRSESRDRIPVEATTEMSAVRDASLVLFSVKSTDTESAARQMESFLASDAIVISMQNGVDNVERIGAVTNIPAVPAAVYIAVSVPEPGQIKHLARGDIVVGPPNDITKQVAEIFGRAGIGCEISNNIEGEMWIKLLCNCALNPISALGRAQYGQIAGSSDAGRLMRAVVEEVLDVARAAKVALPNINDTSAGMAAAMKIATQMAGALSSTAQDLNRGRPTEIDSLNGYIARRGEELGVNVPVNHALFTLIKLAEQQGGT